MKRLWECHTTVANLWCQPCPHFLCSTIVGSDFLHSTGAKASWMEPFHYFAVSAKQYINDTLPPAPFSPHPDSHPLELLFRWVHSESLVIGVLFFKPIVVVEFAWKIGDMATIAGWIAIVTYSWPRFWSLWQKYVLVLDLLLVNYIQFFVDVVPLWHHFHVKYSCVQFSFNVTFIRAHAVFAKMLEKLFHPLPHDNVCCSFFTFQLDHSLNSG